MHRPVIWTFTFVFLSMVSSQLQGQSEETRAPQKLKTLNDHFPFVVPDSRDGWESRAEALRRRVLVGTGLWPMPEKTTITPVLHGKIERDGFTVEKVYFESLPGHFVTGMLFRPSSENQNGVIDGKRPGVLCPHGHGGRTMRLDDATLAKQIETGGEVFERSGRYPKLARCAHLARMGCVSFIFDMLGYADSQQIEFNTAHRHADARPEEADRSQPCFYSIDADLNLQTIMGLQTWNAVRALDFLAELPDVDADRLAVTGGSGGGTQTILLGAIDPRIKVGFPNGMVSTSMQGGCYCENCNYLRIGTGNVELAALFAPKPQGMTSANDWTKAMLTDGYPQLKQLYEMLGVKQDVMCGDMLKYPHNYNYITRAMMYRWMAKHLPLPGDTPLIEQDFQPFSEAEMKVWDDEHPAPKSVGIPHERKVLAWWKDQNDQQLSKLIPDPAAKKAEVSKQLSEYRRVVGGAWKVFFDREMPSHADLEIVSSSQKADQPNSEIFVVRHPKWKTEVRVLVQKPSSGPSKRTVFVADAKQQASAVTTALAAGMLSKTFEQDKQSTVVMIDFGSDPKEQRLIDDKRNYSALTFGYNRPLVAKRYEQILCALVAFSPDAEQRVLFWADGDLVGPAATAAAVVAGDAIDVFILHTNQFRFASVEDYRDSRFLPGAAKYFDLPGLMSLRAPRRMVVIGETDNAIDLVKRVYEASSASSALQINSNP